MHRGKEAASQSTLLLELQKVRIFLVETLQQEITQALGEMRSSQPNSIGSELELTQPVSILVNFWCPELDQMPSQQPVLQPWAPLHVFDVSWVITCFDSIDPKAQRVGSVALTSGLGMHPSVSQHAQIHVGIIPWDEFPMSLKSLCLPACFSSS